MLLLPPAYVVLIVFVLCVLSRLPCEGNFLEPHSLRSSLPRKYTREARRLPGDAANLNPCVALSHMTPMWWYGYLWLAMAKASFAHQHGENTMTGAPEGERITCEDLTDETFARYTSEGYTLAFAEDVMRRDLRDLSDLPAPILPAGLTLAAWTSDAIPAFFAAYAAAFADRPGFP